MNVLILGSGGREHALAWKISQSKKLNNLYIAPGNAGTNSCGININIDIKDFESIKKNIIEYKIDIVVVGPEDLLVKGISDFFKNDEYLKKIAIIGPSKEGAMLEGSKSFAKKFMLKNKIPTSKFISITVDNLDEGIGFLKNVKPPYVLKADGLAAGKGVMIIPNFIEAIEMICEMLKGKFGISSRNIVIEEFLTGQEVSVFVITDGISYKLLPEAKDYKKIGENETGLNTGGMGAVSPVPFADRSFMNKVEERIIKPTIKGLLNENIIYKGFIFFGLINVEGNPYVIEYNARLGDPETEVIIPRIKSDILDIFESVINNNLRSFNIEISNKTAVNIVLASEGYPLEYKKGYKISNLEKIQNSLVFHSGTISHEKKIVTNGGRVLSVTSYGNNLKEALNLSLNSANIINFKNKYFRKDIGFDIL